METRDLRNKLVAVLGFGQEGKATAGYLIKHGIKPVLFDQRTWDSWEEKDQAYIKALNINFIFGPEAFKELARFDIAFRSPGIKLGLLKDFKGALTSQTKFFFDSCPAKIIGVTGTKGKGTTASLIYEIQQANSYKLKAKSYLTGNIGKVQPLEIIDELKPEDWVVYELSSFQLQDLEKSPYIGVVVMTTSEHLDYHKDQNEYLEAKAAIVKYQSAQDFAIVNADFPNSLKIGEQGKGQKIYFSRQNELKSGVYVKDDQIIVKNVNGKNFQFSISNFQLRGAHNLENVCAAIAASVCAECDANVIQSTVESFKGLEHRLEFVVEKNGIKFYNDSFSTTPETAIAAIESFSEPLIVVLGGSSKNSDFKKLGKTVGRAQNIKSVVLIGKEAEKIEAVIRENGDLMPKLMKGANSMKEIFDQVKLVASTGDVVLLSPACASFDIFKNYQDRGEQFKLFAKMF